jgi:hypothetical protein
MPFFVSRWLKMSLTGRSPEIDPVSPLTITDALIVMSAVPETWTSSVVANPEGTTSRQWAVPSVEHPSAQEMGTSDPASLHTPS